MGGQSSVMDAGSEGWLVQSNPMEQSKLLKKLMVFCWKGGRAHSASQFVEYGSPYLQTGYGVHADQCPPPKMPTMGK